MSTKSIFLLGKLLFTMYGKSLGADAWITVFLCSSLPCPSLSPSLGRALFEYIEDLTLTYEADQDVYLYYSLGTEN